MTEPGGGRRQRVRAQYERWPYPHVPIVGAVRPTDTWQLSAAYLWDRCGSGVAPRRPRVWIAGCGTMQPYTFRLANPRAEILASDVSQRSLTIARRRCRWHGVRRVRFERIDLTDAGQFPDGPFDLIECYGVLMNLDDPLAALRGLAERLAERGVLRIMVYPHYSRRRVFQLQRVAKLCGLRFDEPGHPRMLRAIVAGLPRSHPLRFAFETYADARNDAGLVDGFLHAGDRGFTGSELGALIAGAGLRPAFWFQREWARPDVMAPRLRLDHTSQSFVAHYLDLWQELRGNFVVCLVRDTHAPAATTPDRVHPMLSLGDSAGPRDAVRRLAQRVTGVRARNRIGDDLALAARDVRGLRTAVLDDAVRDRLRTAGALLGGAYAPASLPDHGGVFTREPEPRLEVGEGAANPFYQHLFDAWRTGPAETAGALPDLAEQLEAWRDEADPLEDAARPFGLTPTATYPRFHREIDDYLARRAGISTVNSWEEWPLPERAERALQRLLPLDRLPAGELSRAARRELWALLASHEQLFVDVDA